MREAWRRVGRAGWTLWVLLAAVGLAGCGMPEGGTPQGREIHHLYNILFISGGVVFVLVEGAIVWAVVRYRRRDDELPRQTHGNNLLEIIWTLIPLAIVSVLFVYGWGGINALAKESPNPDRVIRVEGFQWQWNFTYVGERLAVKPGEEQRSLTLEGTIARPPKLVLPVGQSVRFELQSADVIHSFFIPGWNYKKDVVPGRNNSFEVTPDRLGTFPGQCAEYCGLAHNDMHFTVEVVQMAEFRSWLAEAKRQAVSGCPNDPNPLSISSLDIAFDKNCLAAPGGRPFQIKFDNEEAVPHNIAVFKGNDANGENVFRGEVFSGPREVDYPVRALQAGSYFFHCDVHPQAMKGKLIVR
jgi:cytochrome c oxidase subunit 2